MSLSLCVRACAREKGGKRRNSGGERETHRAFYLMTIFAVLTATKASPLQPSVLCVTYVSLVVPLISSICASNATSMATGIGQPLAVGALHDQGWALEQLLVMFVTCPLALAGSIFIIIGLQHPRGVDHADSNPWA